MNINWKTVSIGVLMALVLLFILSKVNELGGYVGFLLASMYVGYTVGENYTNGAINGALVSAIAEIIAIIFVVSAEFGFIPLYGIFVFALLIGVIIEGIIGAVGGIMGVFIKRLGLPKVISFNVEGFKMSKICPNCGKQNKNTAKFCANCGESLNNIENTQEGIKDWWDNRSSNSKYGIGLIGFCCVIMIVGLIVAGISAMPSSDTTSTYSQSASSNTQTVDTSSQPIILSGKGQEATKTFHLNGGLTRFEMTHNGESNFIIHLMDTDGNIQEFVVNEIGAYNGSQAFNVPEGDYLLNVDADGSWTVKITQGS